MPATVRVRLLAVATVRVLVSLDMHCNCLAVFLFRPLWPSRFERFQYHAWWGGQRRPGSIVEAIDLLTRSQMLSPATATEVWLRSAKNNHDVGHLLVAMWKALSSRSQMRYDQVVWFIQALSVSDLVLQRCRCLFGFRSVPQVFIRSVFLLLIYLINSNYSFRLRKRWQAFLKNDNDLWSYSFPWRLIDQLSYAYYEMVKPCFVTASCLWKKVLGVLFYLGLSGSRGHKWQCSAMLVFFLA